jgi:hypothetical protein
LITARQAAFAAEPGSMAALGWRPLLPTTDDDASAAARAHHRHRGPERAHHAHELQVERLGPDLVVEVEEGAATAPRRR